MEETTLICHKEPCERARKRLNKIRVFWVMTPCPLVNKLLTFFEQIDDNLYAIFMV